MKYAALLAIMAAIPAQAHMALFAKGMYGGQPGIRDSDQVVQPLRNEPFAKWWFHGFVNEPPPEGEFLEIPVGGKTQSWASCNKHWTPMAGEGMQYPQDPGVADSEKWACPSGRDAQDQLKDLRGCGLGIAYESDISKIKPEDFVVISTIKNCVWKLENFFEIPADLPPCPPGGCHCLWGWQHSPNGGVPAEIFQNGFRCNVTGATGTRALPKPEVARKCPFDKNNCTAGAKQMLYWGQAEGNNIDQGEYDMPFYNGDYGFTDGAQKDLWLAAPAPRDTMAWTGDQLKTTANAYLQSFTPSATGAAFFAEVPSTDVQSTPAEASSAAVQPTQSPEQGLNENMAGSGKPVSASSSVSPSLAATFVPASASASPTAVAKKKCHAKRRQHF